MKKLAVTLFVLLSISLVASSCQTIPSLAMSQPVDDTIHKVELPPVETDQIVGSTQAMDAGIQQVETGQNIRWEYKTVIAFLGSDTTPNITTTEQGTDCNMSTMPCFAEDGDQTLKTRLNTLGMEGWELVSFDSPNAVMFVFIFKRPIP